MTFLLNEVYVNTVTAKLLQVRIISYGKASGVSMLYDDTPTQ
jgi:hypothetical protein